MRYHYRPIREERAPVYGETYECDHPVYDRCTVYILGGKGLAVIQQRFGPIAVTTEDKTLIGKYTFWTELDPELVDQLYLHPKFMGVFNKRSGPCKDGLYPTMTVRQLMWALRMKPLKKERWETAFDRRSI